MGRVRSYRNHHIALGSPVCHLLLCDTRLNCYWKNSPLGNKRARYTGESIDMHSHWRPTWLRGRRFGSRGERIN